MLNKEQLQNLLVFDIETVGQYSSLDGLILNNPEMAELWSKKAKLLRNKPEHIDKTDEELYFEMSPLFAEFAKILVISIGLIRFDINNIPKIYINNIGSADEAELLLKTQTLFQTANTKNLNTTLCGHNIKKFDIPFMGRRFLIKKLAVPSLLNTFGKKPWELKFLDTAELWSFGSWSDTFVSLELLATSLGLESPKDDICGNKVNETWHKGGDLERIKTYCSKDVIVTCKALLEIAGLLPDNIKIEIRTQ